MGEIAVRQKEVRARANWGRWLADCSWCPSALRLEPGTEAFRCWDCGLITEGIIWPADPDAIALVLSMRPDPNTRSWTPGETVDDLLVQNAEHGIIPPEWEALAERLPSGQLKIVESLDGRVTGGILFAALESSRTPAELEAERQSDWRLVMEAFQLETGEDLRGFIVRPLAIDGGLILNPRALEG